MKKRLLLILLVIVGLAAIDFALESPFLFNFEILFPKDFQTKFYHATIARTSLSQPDIDSIYTQILREHDSVVVETRLWDFRPGSRYVLKELTSLRLDSSTQSAVSAKWRVRSYASRFVPEFDSTYGLRIARGQENVTLIWVSPIKQIQGSYYVAYEWYCGLTCAGVLVYKADKFQNRWKVEPIFKPWVS